MPGTVTLERHGTTSVLTLRRPEARNALSPELLDELAAALAEAAAPPEIRVVVLAAEGPVFCAGADLRRLAEMQSAGLEAHLAEARRLAETLKAVARCPKPVIARVQGPAYGGGVGLAAACDLVATVETAQFCFSEVKLGLIPAVIAPFVLRRISAGAARRYFLTAEPIPAAEAKRLGLVSETAPDLAALEELVGEWSARLAAGAPGALIAARRLLDAFVGPELDSALEAAVRAFAERRVDPEAREGIAAFLERRPPRWTASSPTEAPGVP